MIDICVLTALWHRPEVARIMFTGINRLQDYKPDKYNIHCLAVGSQPDLFRPLCRVHGIEYHNHPNNPLGLKWNYGLKQCMEHDFDFLMLMGSDDLVSNSLLDLYEPFYSKYYVLGVRDMYAFSIRQNEAIYFPGYQDISMSIGAGRMIHREAIERTHGKLWRDLLNRGLDGSCSQRLMSQGIGEEVITAKGKAAVIDIKSDLNLNKFSDFKGEFVDKDALFSQIGETEKTQLKELINEWG